MSFIPIIFCVAAVTFATAEITNPKIEDVPYFASIRSKEGNHICFGAIIKPNLVVAPLNCIQSDSISVHAGNIDPESSDTKDVQIVQVKEIDRRIFGRGIRVAALLTLEDDLEVEQTNTVKTIGLKMIPEEGDKVTLNGFGVDLDKKESIKKLTSFQSKVAKYEDCYKTQQVPTYNDHIFCVDKPESNLEACKVIGPATLVICNEGTKDVLCGFAYGDGYCIDAEKPNLTFIKTNAVFG